MRTFDRLLHALTLLPFAWLGAAACGGSVFDSASGGAGHGGSAAAGSGAGGSSSAGAPPSGAAGLPNVAGTSSAGTSSGGSSGALGNGGSAGVDLRGCTSNSECQVTPVSCCSCGFGPVSEFTSINEKHSLEYAARCQTVDCAGCPPVAHQIDNPFSYYVPTCQAPLTADDLTRRECQVVDLRGDRAEVTACKLDTDCMLRAGAGCCSSCGGGEPIAIAVGKEAALQKLVCGNEPTACAKCAPSFTGFKPQCEAGHCRVQFAP